MKPRCCPRARQATATKMDAQVPEGNSHLRWDARKTSRRKVTLAGVQKWVGIHSAQGPWENTAQARARVWARGSCRDRRDQRDIRRSGQVSRGQPQRASDPSTGGPPEDTEPGDSISSERGESNPHQRTKTQWTQGSQRPWVAPQEAQSEATSIRRWKRTSGGLAVTQDLRKLPTLPVGQQNKLQPEVCGLLGGGRIDAPPMCVLLSSQDASVHCLT